MGELKKYTCNTSDHVHGLLEPFPTDSSFLSQLRILSMSWATWQERWRQRPVAPDPAQVPVDGQEPCGKHMGLVAEASPVGRRAQRPVEP